MKANVRIHPVWPTYFLLLAFVLFVYSEFATPTYNLGYVYVRLVVTCFLILAMISRIVGYYILLSKEGRQTLRRDKQIMFWLLIFSMGFALPMACSLVVPETYYSVWWLAMASLGALLGIEISVSDNAFAQQYEKKRVLEAMVRGFSLGMLVNCVALLNYLLVVGETYRSDFGLRLSRSIEISYSPTTDDIYFIVGTLFVPLCVFLAGMLGRRAI